MRARIAAGFLPAVLLAAQSPAPAEEDPGLIITAESTLVVVPLHVYRKKTTVGGLGPEAFELREDGAVQNIAFVEGPPVEGEDAAERTVPTEIIFLLDVSHSVMRRGLLDGSMIGNSMLKGLRAGVSISVYGFAGKLHRFSGPTRDPAKLQRALDLAYAAEAGGSRVYEAIMQTARDAANRGGNASRMIVVFSDGFSTTKLSPDLVARSANALGIPLYPVVLGHGEIAKRAARGALQIRQPSRNNPTAGARRQSYANMQELRQRHFADIGPKTGGRSYDLTVINNMVIRKMLTSLATLAQTEYIVGYYPGSVDEPLTAHEVEIRLTDKSVGKLYGGRRLIVH